MISERGLAALRVAAMLCHSMPGIGVRIRDGETTLLHVIADRHGRSVVTDAPVFTPCAFRCAVAKAHRRQQRGERLAFMGLPGDPAVDIGTPEAGLARPGGIYRVPIADRWLWAFASTLDAAIAYRTGADLVASVALPAVHVFGIRPDPALDVHLVYAETTARPESPDEDALIDVLESLLARWTSYELIRACDSGSSEGRRLA